MMDVGRVITHDIQFKLHGRSDSTGPDLRGKIDINNITSSMVSPADCGLEVLSKSTNWRCEPRVGKYVDVECSMHTSSLNPDFWQLHTV